MRGAAAGHPSVFCPISLFLERDGPSPASAQSAKPLHLLVKEPRCPCGAQRQHPSQGSAQHAAGRPVVLQACACALQRLAGPIPAIVGYLRHPQTLAGLFEPTTTQLMQSLQNWFVGSAPDQEPAPGASVLSEWNKYSSGASGSGSGVGTAAAGAAPASSKQSDRLLSSAEEGASTGGCCTTGCVCA